MSGRSRVEDWVVVIPAYRHADDTMACIQSLRSAAPSPSHVIVVDDASDDDTVERLRGWAEGAGMPVTVERGSDSRTGVPLQAGLTIIASEENEGFNATSNRGLAAVRDRTEAPYVLLLNNDTVVAPTFFGELSTATESQPHAGVLTGTIYEWDRSTVWYAGGRIQPVRALARHDTEAREAATPYDTEWISGCAMLIAREALERVGLLPECFAPIYSEDVDYSLSAHRAGFALCVVPRAVVYHRVGRSVGQPGSQRPAVTYVSSRNRTFVVRRNYRGWRRAAALGYLAVTKPVRALVETLRGRPRTGWAMLAGTVAGMFSRAARR